MDFLFVVKSTSQVKGFVEVKKSTEFTSLALESDATAQELREVHITLTYAAEERARIPFRPRSFGVAEKRAA